MGNKEPKSLHLSVRLDPIIGVFDECPECHIGIFLVERDAIETLLSGHGIAAPCGNCGNNLMIKLRLVDPISPDKMARQVKNKAREMRARLQESAGDREDDAIN